MDSPQLIPLNDVVLRDDLDPRLGERDDDLIQQYADIFDALPPIEINQQNELIDGWHRVRAAQHAERTDIAYVVVETESDDDLADKMWAANLKHGVQYTRLQRKTQGIKLHGRGLMVKDIAQRVGVSVSSVYSWTKEQREQEKQERDAEIVRLREEGMTQQEIADELGVAQGTIAKNILDSKTGKRNNKPESEAEPAIEADEEESKEAPEGQDEGNPEVELAPDDTQTKPDRDEELTDEEPDTQDQDPEPLPELIPIPADILKTARAVMGAVSETRPDDYVARLDASGSEWMTITDDSLSNELERELLTSAAAMCLWQELMIWYQGERTSAFTDAFGKIGPVFVRGQAGQWTIVSKLRSILRRLW